MDCLPYKVKKEKTDLPWDCHGDNLAETTVVKSVKASYLTSGDIYTTLWHHTNASLRIWQLKCVDIMHKRYLRSDLKIPDDTVTLAWKQNNILKGQYHCSTY